MDKEQIESIKKILLAKIEYLESKLSKSGATPFPDYGEDEESAVSEVEDYDTNLGLNNDLEKDLNAARTALKRIEEGNFGVCQKCGRQIERKRIEAYPAAAFCLDCGK